MAGGPSQFETFDWKPELQAARRPALPGILHQRPAARPAPGRGAQGPRPVHRFPETREDRHRDLRACFPHFASVADELCVIRSMQTEQINHDTAHAFMNTGSIIKGRPSMGSWLLYGLGAETEDLPGFIVLTSAGQNRLQPVSARQWSSGVLPSKFQGIQFQSKGDRRALHRQSRRRLPEHAAAGRRGNQAAQRLARRGADRPRNPDAHRAIRDGVQACRPPCPDLTDHEQGTRQDAGTCTASRSRATAASPPTACSPAAWPSAACA